MTRQELIFILHAYLQVNTNGAVAALGSRGRILDDAMAELALALLCGWFREPNGTWSFDWRRDGHSR